MWQFDQINPDPSNSSPLTESQESGSGSGSQAGGKAQAVIGRSVSSRGVCLDEFFADSLLFSGSNHTTGLLDARNRVVATSCTSDWRQLQPGDIFVAVEDEWEDGHEKACEVSRRGAKAVVCERPVPVFNVPTYLVQDSRVAFGALCHALVDYPARALSTVAVTGTQGKTTVVALLESIFAMAGKHAGTLSDLGCYDGMSHSAGLVPKTTSTVFASRLAKMSASGCSHALLEVSSRALAQSVLAGMELNTVCVTNVTSGHLDLHSSTQNYREVKRRILDYLSPGGVVVLCADDPGCLSWLDSLQGPVLTYGMGPQAEISGSIVEQNSGEQLFVISAGSESVAVRTSLVGEHHIANCLGAAATAFSYGIDLSTIARGLEAVDWLPGRMERVDCGQGFPVFVDVAHTPDALRASLRTARRLASRRVICVLGDGGEGSAQECTQVNGIVDAMADLTIAVQSSVPAIPTWGNEGLRSSRYLARDRSEAIAQAVKLAEVGDVVVITGSQVGPLGCFGQEGRRDGGQEAIDDVEVARELLYLRDRSADRLAA